MLRLFIFVIASLCFLAPAAAQEKYPDRPIEYIVPWGPGGGADQLARKTGKLLEPALGVSIPVLNVAGANGVTGLSKMLSAPADGYTISVMTADTFALLTSPETTWKYGDFTPLAVMLRQPSAFFVASGGKYKSWADVETAAKAGPVKVGISGFGSPDEMTINFFNKKGMKFVGVPFPKPGERYSAVLGGHIDVLFEQLGDVRSMLEGNQLTPVMIFAKQPFKPFPGVPVSGDLGHDFSLPQFRIVIAKSGTDPKRLETLSGAFAKAAKDPEYAAFLENQYADADSFLGGKDADTFLREQLAAMKSLGK